jgi:hypothetical protein
MVQVMVLPDIAFEGLISWGLYRMDRITEDLAFTDEASPDQGSAIDLARVVNQGKVYRVRSFGGERALQNRTVRALPAGYARAGAAVVYDATGGGIFPANDYARATAPFQPTFESSPNALSVQDLVDLINASNPYIYSGTVYANSQDARPKIQNNGHLGDIDTVEGIGKLHGINVYNAFPTPVGMLERSR